MSKTKIIEKYLNSFLKKNELEVVRQYKYLGPILNYNGKFTEAKKQLVVKGNRAIFCYYVNVDSSSYLSIFNSNFSIF